LEIPEAHICCGSAGTYNMLQPELSAALRVRKQKNIASTTPDAVATGNIGCITQIALGGGYPVLHLVELLDWATEDPRRRRLPPTAKSKNRTRRSARFLPARQQNRRGKRDRADDRR